jgi:hypothetical protein
MESGLLASNERPTLQDDGPDLLRTAQNQIAFKRNLNSHQSTLNQTARAIISQCQRLKLHPRCIRTTRIRLSLHQSVPQRELPALPLPRLRPRPPPYKRLLHNRLSHVAQLRE